MKKIIFLLLISSFLLLNKTIAQSLIPVPYYKMTTFDSSPYKSIKYGGGSTWYRMRFRLLLPKGYDSSNVSTTTYPMVVMLHGFGESAFGRKGYNDNSPYASTDPRIDNNDHQLKHHGYEYLYAVNNGKFPGFVLFPQNANGDWTEPLIDDMVTIVKLLITKLKIDPNRIYLAGLSSGGQGVLDAMKRYTNVFASGISYSGIKLVGEINAPRIAHLPFWYFQGGKDSSPSPSYSAPTIQALRDAGGTPTYSFYPDVDHGTWYAAIKEPDLFPFLLRYSKLSIHPYFGKTQFDPGETINVKLGISPDFAAYEWRKDGVLIPGANIEYIMATSAGSYTVRFKRLNSNLTVSDWTAWSDPLIININTAPVINVNPVSITRAAGQTASFSVIATGKGPLIYQWRKDGVDIPGANASTYSKAGLQASDAGFYDVVITNSLGTATSISASLTVDTTYFVTINTPATGTYYNIGKVIPYSGSFTSAQGGATSVVTWTLNFHTPSGIFGVWVRNGINPGSITIPKTNETSPNVFYRLTLKATDSQGKEATDYKDILPTLTNITLTTDPPGLKVYLDTMTKVGPYSFSAVVGTERNLNVLDPQTLGSKTYKFTGWAHGGASSQKITVPAVNSITYTALFVEDTVTDPLAIHFTPEEELKIKDNLTVYPNPTVNHLYVDIKAEQGERLIMGITNSVGISFMSHAVTAEVQGVNSFDIDVSTLKGNSYILRVQKGKGVYFRHFFITR